MATVTHPPLAKPVRARLILEAAAAAVSLILIAWLLLWFIWQAPRATAIRAFIIPELGVPYQGADQRALLAAAIDSDGRALPLNQLESALSDAVSGRGDPIVVSVSAPTIASGPQADGLDQERIVSLVTQVAQKARSPVLLAVDLSQLRSDRERGVFGNAPTQGLSEALQAIDVPAESPGIGILFSCAPGQTSWMIDDLGRSVFSYYLQRGLEGEAIAWTDRGRGGQMSLDGLGRYIQHHVTSWVRENRNAVQTPELMTLGSGSDRITFSPIRPPDTSSTDASLTNTEALNTSETVAKSNDATPPGDEKSEDSPPPPTPNPIDTLLKTLVDEWKAHDALLLDDPPAYRLLPAHWKLYERDLLLADRLVREAFRDPQMRQSASQRLMQASSVRSNLTSTLSRRQSDQQRFPIRNLESNRDAQGILREALEYLTGRSVEQLARREVPAAPSPSAEAVEQPEAESSFADERQPTPPPELIAATRGVHEMPYLELQLPAWAFRFTERDAFHRPDYFRNATRGDLLLRTTLSRRIAETSLARDHRGLLGIAKTIEQGDRARRDVQDHLFALDEVIPRTIEERLKEAQGHYQSAKVAIDRFARGRALLERIFAQLPALAEWKVRDTSWIAPADEASLPDSVVQALDAADALAKRLATVAIDPSANSTASEELDRAIDTASRTFNALLDQFNDRATKLSRGQWQALHQLLDTPLLPWQTRETLLKHDTKDWRSSEQPPPSRQPRNAAAPEVRFDRAWMAEAAALAKLDARLRLLAETTSPDGASESLLRMDRAADDLRDRLVRTEDTGSPDDLLDRYSSFSDAVGEVRRSFTGSVTRRLPTAADALFPILWNDESRYRLRCATEIELMGQDAREDQPTRRLDAFGQRLAALLHAQRLVEDNDRDGAELLRRAASEAQSWIGVEEIQGGPEIRPRSGVLALQWQPATDRLNIDPAGVSVSFQIAAVNRNAEVPEGLAFVAALMPTGESGAWLTLRAEQSPERSRPDRIPGGLVSVGPVVQSDPPTVSFVATQEDLDVTGSPEANIQARGFYRGKVIQGDGNRPLVMPIVARDFGHPVEISIAQNLEPLRRKLAPFNISVTPERYDVFALNNGTGFMHQDTDLPYILTISNTRQRPLRVRIVRTLLPADGKQDEPILLGETKGVELQPGTPWEIRSTMKAIDVRPRDEDRYLRIQVFEEGAAPDAEPIREKTVRFHQMSWKTYLTVQAAIDPKVTRVRATDTPFGAFVVTLSRLEGDPVREPITHDEISCTLKQTVTKPPASPDKWLIPGKSMYFDHTLEADEQYPWRLRVGNVTITSDLLNGPPTDENP
ncbi:hypothetical protein [Tautonia marina]|uniref:hypothetical protein n=1 Tax=Tautonia marina TaxID=2653855 RepID=UPI00126120CC|nr:hypothetical protein [Tautonia marina]